MGTDASAVILDTPQVSDSLDEPVMWAAHELRGPLHAARAALDHVIELSVNGEVEPALVLRIRDELDDVLELIDPLLRCAAGVVARDVDTVDLARLAREAANAEAHTTRGGRDRMTIAALGPTWVLGNAVLLRVAVGNLVRNALSYSCRDQRVSVSVQIANGTAIVSVRDEGEGVPPEERDTIFERGRRGAATGSAERGGLGLGLFIARRIAEEHGGSVRLAESPCGADFRLELPLAAAERC